MQGVYAFEEKKINQLCYCSYGHFYVQQHRADIHVGRCWGKSTINRQYIAAGPQS